jgi:hypothetical protein
MGVGESQGKERGLEAVKMAISCPLMGNRSIKGARNLLINIVGPEDLKAKEFSAMNKFLVELAGPGVKVFSGLAADPSLNDSGIVKVTVIATGLSPDEAVVEPENEPVLEEDEGPITLQLNPEPPIAFVSEPSQQSPRPQAEPIETSEPPARRTVRLGNFPLQRVPQERVPTQTGFNKYAQSSLVDQNNLFTGNEPIRKPVTTPQRMVQGQNKRGVDEARSSQIPSYMRDNAD